ncbi:MAG TPA: amino acid adenylation domain-containing protein, partial [Pyrinomonadaceae bacterium]|nr:amino acid adenylation domain-containing protein [Pyrinomonadaceae bacterium]
MSTVVENIGLDVSGGADYSGLAVSRIFGPRIEQFRNQTFLRLFEEQVRQHPLRTAAISHDGDLNYSELDARANQVARMLRANRASRESIVGICIDRSIDMAIGIVGILKAGAAYLPLDPDYPKDRLAWLLHDSAVSTIVTKSTLAEMVSDAGARLILLDGGELEEQSKEKFDANPQSDDLAYVIYTSGSTGEPKGVEIEHGNLANYLLALQHEIQLTAADRYLHTASISFSSSRRQLLLPLSQGATVVIANSEERKDPLALFEMIKRNDVSVMDAVPSFWRTCTDLLLSLDTITRARLLDNRLRLMLSASEPLLSDIPDTWKNRFNHAAEHIHMFGQTETAGIVCTYRVRERNSSDVAMVPIGKPIANTDIYILDEDKQLAPLGTPGELYIGGAGVGRGYLKRPDISAHKFIIHSFEGEPPVRLYRTGDFARLTGAGVIEFSGRQDSQVKLRGFRIELGEIEAALVRHPDVKECAVIIRNAASGTKELVAYFVGRETSPAASDLRSFLAKRLPDYMVPATFVELKALPLTANGKIDKRALPEPTKVRADASTAYDPPSTATEKRVANIWETVLGIRSIGMRDNFFELGGHSLLAIQVIARLNSEYKRVVPLRTLFDHPTVAELSASLDHSAVEEQTNQQIQPVNRDRPLALSFPQQRLWFIDQLENGSSLYNIRKAFRLHGRVDP